MYRNKSVNLHQFAMIPRADIPRSAFRMQKAYKTTFDAGWLIPFLVEEILPGDTFNLKANMFARLSTPLVPTLDNMVLESFFFFCPNRLVWTNWNKMMGERDNPDDSISFLTPTQTSPVGGYDECTLHDYMGLPVSGQVEAASTITHSALPLRMYNLIYNEWFRDQNLQDSLPVDVDDGPDDPADYNLVLRGKRHDYFTSCLPWPQKGDAVSVPLSGQAPVVVDSGIATGNSVQVIVEGTTTGRQIVSNTAGLGTTWGALSAPGQPHQLFADLTAASTFTINAIRTSFQIQRLLERDARGGTRYTEILFTQFGVRSPDSRLQRPEYLGGGRTPIVINPIAQTAQTNVDEPAETPLGFLGAMGTLLASGHGFTQSFVEHGYVIGLISVRADLTYQQGLRRHWSRQTRYDYYWPAFAMLGEQEVLSKEIYATGEAGDDDVFGYQERWAEYRYSQSEITGFFRSTNATPIDFWHYSQEFATRPVLNDEFIQDPTGTVLDRSLAEQGLTGRQFLFDAFIDIKAARPMPLYSVPGMIDHL